MRLIARGGALYTKKGEYLTDFCRKGAEKLFKIDVTEDPLEVEVIVKSIKNHWSGVGSEMEKVK